jgi:hypothetical protein
MRADAEARVRLHTAARSRMCDAHWG